METNLQAELVLDCQNRLGEGPIWDHRSQELIWVDIQGQKVHSYHPASARHTQIAVPEWIGTVVPAEPGKLIVALANGVFELDRQSENLSLIVDPEPGNDENRLNDGKCDPAGRLWVGSMPLSEDKPTGALYRIEPDGRFEKMLSGLTIPNGLIWSHDRRTFYYIDTVWGHVKAFDYDLASGDIRNGRIVIEIPEGMGFPDGMTIDEEGMLWIALWGGCAVGRWHPETGELLQTVSVPAANVTACAFGGPDLATLYITCARIKTDLEAFPMAGALFSVVPGVRGVESDFFVVS
jgi:sugar lactone lactonase YvrE